MTEPPSKWIAESWSVTGSSHLRTSTCNQDFGAFELINTGQDLIAAVADGHGSKKCFRSERGSKYAVEAALFILKSYVANLPYSERASAIRIDLDIEIPRAIVRYWQKKVDSDLFDDPPSVSILDNLTSSERKSFDSNPRVAYGTTLVAALIISELSAYIQIGDGDLLIVAPANDEYQVIRPIPADPRSFANDTASLSSQEFNPSEVRPMGGGGPWSDFRTRVIDNSIGQPAFILLTTDGYPNAFVNDLAFRAVATDIISLLKTEGWHVINSQMPLWLDEASKNGSGDDVTVFIAFCPQLLGLNSYLNIPNSVSFLTISEKAIDSSSGPVIEN